MIAERNVFILYNTMYTFLKKLAFTRAFTVLYIILHNWINYRKLLATVYPVCCRSDMRICVHFNNNKIPLRLSISLKVLLTLVCRKLPILSITEFGCQWEDIAHNEKPHSYPFSLRSTSFGK